MVNSRDILETINMIDNEHLDVRTITMGISLLDCIDSNIQTACTKVYDKICRYAKDLVKTGEDISKEYGIPIINKRIAVSPIAMLAGACNGKSPIYFAHALDKAAKEVGVNFIGGYSALVHKGFSAGDYALISSIPQALAETDFVCSSVNIGSTKAGINMDAVAKMGKVVRKAAELTADRDCIGAAKLVVFCNAPEDNPFMAIIFCRTKRRVDALEEAMAKNGYNCAKLHSDIQQSKRERIMKSFRNADIQYLIATDVASRGLDISGVDNIYNYDIPETAADYVHRIGRTGRAGKGGYTCMFIDPKNIKTLNEIEETIKFEIPRREI